MPGATKVEPPRPPLSPHALSFENGGWKRRLDGAQRARAGCHGGTGKKGTKSLFRVPSRNLLILFLFIEPIHR